MRDTKKLTILAVFFLVLVTGASGLAYIFRGNLPEQVQAFIITYIDIPPVMGKGAAPPAKAKLSNRQDLERWLTATLLCRPDSILDVQDEAFIKQVKMLGVNIEGNTEPPISGDWVFHKPLTVLGRRAIDFDYWADSGSGFAATLSGKPETLVKQLGAKKVFFPPQAKDSWVIFTQKPSYEGGIINIPPYTFIRDDEKGNTIVGCASSDG